MRTVGWRSIVAAALAVMSVNGGLGATPSGHVSAGVSIRVAHTGTQMHTGKDWHTLPEGLAPVVHRALAHDATNLGGSTWSQQAEITTTDGGYNFGYSVALSGDTALVGASTNNTAYVFVHVGNMWVQQATLAGTDGAVDDEFGYSVALSGDTALIGARNVNLGYTRAAYVFVRSGSGSTATWTQQAELYAPCSCSNLGFSVALDGNTALLGMPRDSQPGYAYVFVRSGTTWTQQAMLSSSTGTSDQFGWSVALSSNTALIGAQCNNVCTGAVYVFMRSGNTWTQQTEITASDGMPYDTFGASVAFRGNTALIGAQLKNNNTGAAYVFVHSGTIWTQQAEIIATGGVQGGRFGASVALSGDTALVGAPGKSAAYVFARNRTSWSQQAELTPSGGSSVALNGGTALIGAPMNGAGAAYVFVLPASLAVSPTNGIYQQNITLTGTNLAPNEIVKIYADRTDQPALWSPMTDATGSFVFPSTVAQQVYGPHTVIAVGQISGLSATASFTQLPSLHLAPTTGKAGSQVTARGYGFGVSEPVSIHWNAPNGTLLGTTTSNTHGTFAGAKAVTFTVPASTPGTYLVYALGQHSGARSTATFTVQ